LFLQEQIKGRIVAGLYIARPPTTSVAGINLALSAVQHPLTNCRLYYSQVTVDPQKSFETAEQLTSSGFGVSTGLISQGYWEASKWYFVNVERSNIADKLQPRNLDVSFTNNSNVPIDVIIFTFYSDQIVIDVETGIVTK